MPETLGAPASTFTPHFADPENARQAGLRSAQLAKERQQELDNLRQIIATKPLADIQPPKPADLEVQQQINLTNELITHARKELARLQDDEYGYCEACKRHGGDAKEQAALLRELRGLMEHMCRLHNIAQAPTSKAQQPRQARQALPEPTPIVAPVLHKASDDTQCPGSQGRGNGYINR